MNYRRYGSLGFDVSALGFGCMRLPTAGDGKIDVPEATRMLHWAMDHGVNYFDTGYPYHGGESEPVLGRALQGGRRERVTLATKLLVRIAEKPSDFDRLLNEQLERLQTDHIDVYLLHGLRKSRWEQAYNMGVLDWAEKARSDGRIRALGFSFHDTFALFREIVDAHDGWDVCQIQYNYMNETYQAGTRGLRYAASKGLAVVVMEPLLGGKLAVAPPSVQTLWDSAGVRRAPAEWALQWLWDQPEISTILSGMSTMKQVQQNVASASRSGVARLGTSELDLIGQARDTYAQLQAAPCTACGYCMPCPNGVNIPRCFTALNDALMFDNMETARGRYFRLMSDEDERSLGDSCIECHECEDKCPQGITISEWMPYIHKVMAHEREYVRREAPGS